MNEYQESWSCKICESCNDLFLNSHNYVISFFDCVSNSNAYGFCFFHCNMRDECTRGFSLFFALLHLSALSAQYSTQSVFFFFFSPVNFARIRTNAECTLQILAAYTLTLELILRQVTLGSQFGCISIQLNNNT